MTMSLESHWSYVYRGCFAVFLVQLLKPALQARTTRLGLQPAQAAQLACRNGPSR